MNTDLMKMKEIIDDDLKYDSYKLFSENERL
jgi:hypothetical protein